MLAYSIFQKKWLLMALVLNSAFLLKLWRYPRQKVFRCMYVTNVCRVANLELRRINSIGNSLFIDAVKISSLFHCVVSYLLLLLLICFSSSFVLLSSSKVFNMQQPHQYLQHPDQSISHHSDPEPPTVACTQENLAQGCCTMSFFTIWHWPLKLVWPYTCLNPF